LREGPAGLRPASSADVEDELRHATAVFSALGGALSPRVVEHLAVNLPGTYEPLVAEAQRKYLHIMAAGSCGPGRAGSPTRHSSRSAAGAGFRGRRLHRAVTVA